MTDPLKTDLVVDGLRKHGLSIAQPAQGYRFSVDPLILCSFAEFKEDASICDLGTGCGIIPLVAANNSSPVHIVGVEMQEQMAEIARRNVTSNSLEGKISILTADVMSLKHHFEASSFDLVLANPPYRRHGTGRISPLAGRDRARHESTATLKDFLTVAKYLVKITGRICFIYHVCRFCELFAEVAALKLAPLRLRMVHGTSDSEAKLFAVELAKGRKGDLKIEAPLIIYDHRGDYTAEMKSILG